MLLSALGLALSGGGWYWLWFIVAMYFFFLDKADEQRTKSQIPPRSTLDTVDPLDPPRAISPAPYAGVEWSGKLTEVCSRYTSPSFYVAELIPKDKLQNALKTYPLNDGGKPIALIDATVFGSAKNGMLIGEHGLSWHNSVVKSKVSTMLWAELSVLAITVVGSQIKIGNDAVFETAGSQFDKKKIVTLLELIGDTWMKSLTAEEEPPPDEPEVARPMSPPPVASERPKLVKTDVNTAVFDSLLALPGIGAADAKLIAQHIQSNGPMASIDEMSMILNLKPHIVERLRPLVTFSTTKPEPPEPPKSSIPAVPAAEQHPMPPRAQGPVRAPIDF